MGLQRFRRTLLQRLQHGDRIQRGKQNAGVLLHHPEQRVIIPGRPVGGDGVEMLPMRLIPCAEALPISRLAGLRKLLECAERTFLHHVVKAIGRAVRQTLDKGVLSGQRIQQRFRAVVLHDEPGHFHGELVGKPHNGQKLPLLFREGVDHGGGKDGGNIGIAVRQRAVLIKHPKIQIDRGKPSLAVIQQRLDLLVGKGRAAAVCIDGKLRVIQPELLRADLIDPSAQPDELRRRQKKIPAGNDQVRVGRQPSCQGAEKFRGAPVCQQVKVVYEDIAGARSRQRMAKILDQQTAAGLVRGADIVLQKIKPRPGKGVLRAFPEDGQIAGINTDPDHGRRFGLGSFCQIPFHRRGLSVAHGRHQGGQSTAGDRPQALLQPLRYIDGVQVPFWLWHDVPLPLCCRAFRIWFHYIGREGSFQGKACVSGQTAAADLLISAAFPAAFWSGAGCRPR